MIKKIIQILKDHKWAILLAFIAAVIIASPQVYLRYDLGDSYQGIEIMGASDDEQNWLPRVREVQDGYPTFSCVFFKDGKDWPYLLQPLGTIMFASSGSLLSLDFNNTILLSRFFFSFIVFLIIYAFVFFLSKNKLTALSITTFFVLAKALFNRTLIAHLLSWGSPSLKFLNLTRPVNPLMTYFFFFGFLLFFWLFLKRKQWRWGILSALFLGLSFYDYFFTWTFLYSFLGVLVIIFLLQKNWQKIKMILAVSIGAAFMAIPYFINVYQVTTTPYYQESVQKAALLDVREPFLGFLVPILFVIFLLFFPKKWKDRFFFGLALVIAPFIVLNQQLITGKVLSYVHYYWYYHKPLAIIFLLMIFFFWLSQRNWHFFKKAFAVFLILASIGCGIWIQSASYAANKEEIIESQKYGPVMDWLNENASKDEVVFSHDELAQLIVIYTPLNVFDHSSAASCLSASNERILNALFLYYKLDGVGKDQAPEVFLADRRRISQRLYGLHYRKTTGDYGGIPDEVIQEIAQKYQASFEVPTVDFLNDLWIKYEVKYLVWDRESNPQWQLDQYSFLEKVAEIGGFAIYEKL